MNNRLLFSSDYMEGAHPKIMEKLVETNMVKTPGYGLDRYTELAKEKIKMACKAPNAEVHFLVGGTQTNATMIDAFLDSYQGVVAADTGHINVHEAGAIEANGHKILTIPSKLGKISSKQIYELLEDFKDDANNQHMVMPGMVYLSQPTEYGTLYSFEELENISRVCHEYHIPLYIDGARLAYALACPQNDVSLSDMASLCDAFYIGGTKCGALFGEAIVISKPGMIPHLFTIIKQHGALLAKGRMLGIQFYELFTGNLYQNIGKTAIVAAQNLKKYLNEKGIELYFESPTNQIFCVVSNEQKNRMIKKVDFGVWQKFDSQHTVIRFSTSWSTKMDDVERLIAVLDQEITSKDM